MSFANEDALRSKDISYGKDLNRFISVVEVSKYTVMIRFSARGAYLLLVPQGRALIRDRALIWDRALI